MHADDCFQGDHAKAADYFAGLNYVCGTYQNPAEYFLKIMTAELLKSKTEETEGKKAIQDNTPQNKEVENKPEKEKEVKKDWRIKPDPDTIDDRISYFVNHYNESPMSSKYLQHKPITGEFLKPDPDITPLEHVDMNSLKYAATPCVQFQVLYRRSLFNALRQNYLTPMRYATNVFFGLVGLALFCGVSQ